MGSNNRDEIFTGTKTWKRPIFSHLDRTIFFNKGIIIWPRKLFYSHKRSEKSRVGKISPSCLHRCQLEHRIQFILLAWGTNIIMKTDNYINFFFKLTIVWITYFENGLNVCGHIYFRFKLLLMTCPWKPLPVELVLIRNQRSILYGLKDQQT